MSKFNALLLGLIGIITSVFIANQRGKKEGKAEEVNKQNKEILKDVYETQKRINKYNSTSGSNKRNWLRERKNPRNK